MAALLLMLVVLLLLLSLLILLPLVAPLRVSGDIFRSFLEIYCLDKGILVLCRS